MERTRLVLAYASNLDGQQMAARCPGARVDSRATLANHALAFGGYSAGWGGAVASVVRAPGARVEGLLYRLTRADLAALDRFEGYPFAYDRVVRVVLDERGRRRRAHVYMQPEEDFEPGVPPPAYFTTIMCAYERLGFDVVPLALAAAGVRQ